MKREFDLYDSARFDGWEYSTSFTVRTYEEFLEALRTHWYRSGFHETTGEVFVYTTISTPDGDVELPLGSYRVAEDNHTITASFRYPELASLEHVACVFLVANLDLSNEDEDMLFHTISKAAIDFPDDWEACSSDELDRISEDLKEVSKNKQSEDCKALGEFERYLNRLLSEPKPAIAMQKAIMHCVEMHSELCSPWGSVVRQGVHLKLIPDHLINEQIIIFACEANFKNIAEIPARFESLDLYQKLWRKFEHAIFSEEVLTLIPDRFKSDLE